MPILDIILLLCFVPAVVDGLSKGFIKQAAGLAAILIAAWAAFHFSPVLGGWLGRYLTMEPNILKVIAFLLIVIVAAFLLDLVASLVTKALGILSLGFFNRILGLLFALLKTALVLGLLILLFETLNSTLHLLRPEATENAAVYHGLKDTAEKIFPILKTFVHA